MSKWNVELITIHSQNIFLNSLLQYFLDFSITLPLCPVAWPAAITLQIVWVRQRQGLAICHLIPTWKRNNSWDKVIVEPRMIALSTSLSIIFFEVWHLSKIQNIKKNVRKEISILRTINNQSKCNFLALIVKRRHCLWLMGIFQPWQQLARWFQHYDHHQILSKWWFCVSNNFGENRSLKGCQSKHSWK